MSNIHILGKKPYALYLSAPMYWSVFNAGAPLVKRSLMQKWSDAYERVMDAGLRIDVDHTILRDLKPSRREAFILEEIEIMDNLTGTNENVAHDATKQETVNAIRSHLQAIDKLMEKL